MQKQYNEKFTQKRLHSKAKKSRINVFIYLKILYVLKHKNNQGDLASGIFTWN